MSRRVTRARSKPCECHGFLPTKTETSACSKSGSGRLAEHLALDPELAGLLLRQRVGGVAHAERPPRGGAVGAAQVVPLPAAAVVHDLLAAVRRRESRPAGWATSSIAVSQSIGSKLPSSRRRSGLVRRSAWF